MFIYNIKVTKEFQQFVKDRNITNICDPVANGELTYTTVFYG